MKLRTDEFEPFLFDVVCNVLFVPLCLLSRGRVGVRKTLGFEEGRFDRGCVSTGFALVVKKDFDFVRWCEANYVAFFEVILVASVNYFDSVADAIV